MVCMSSDTTDQIADCEIAEWVRSETRREVWKHAYDQLARLTAVMRTEDSVTV